MSPVPDPGFIHYVNQPSIQPPDIEPIENGFVWTIEGEEHILYLPFKTVHVRVLT